MTLRSLPFRPARFLGLLWVGSCEKQTPPQPAPLFPSLVWFQRYLKGLSEGLGLLLGSIVLPRPACCTCRACSETLPKDIKVKEDIVPVGQVLPLGLKQDLMQHLQRAADIHN